MATLTVHPDRLLHAGGVGLDRLGEDEALDTITTLVVDQPRKVFKL
jgi:hypothetical protein